MDTPPPFSYLSSIAIHTNVKEMKAAGKTLQDAEKKFTECFYDDQVRLCIVTVQYL